MVDKSSKTQQTGDAWPAVVLSDDTVDNSQIMTKTMITTNLLKFAFSSLILYQGQCISMSIEK